MTEAVNVSWESSTGPRISRGRWYECSELTGEGGRDGKGVRGGAMGRIGRGARGVELLLSEGGDVGHGLLADGHDALGVELLLVSGQVQEAISFRGSSNSSCEASTYDERTGFVRNSQQGQ